MFDTKVYAKVKLSYKILFIMGLILIAGSLYGIYYVNTNSDESIAEYVFLSINILISIVILYMAYYLRKIIPFSSV
jgi:hypothetical protein